MPSTPRKGVAGREVPGATLANDGAAKTGSSKNKKKKAAKKHRKSDSVAKTVQSEATLVNDRDEAEPVNAEYVPFPGEQQPDDDDGATEQAEIENKSKEFEVKIPELTDRENADEQFSDLTPVDDFNYEAETGWHWTVSDHTKDTTWNERSTPAEWADTAVGDIVKRTSADGTQHAQDHAETKRRVVSDWFHAQKAQPYRNLSAKQRQKTIDHLSKLKYPEIHDSEWTKSLRLTVWRAVVRANFFWLNPHTGQPTGKPKPIVRPAGVFENHFEAFVECAAERLDRINRDLPNAEYVKKVEDEVRNFLTKVEYDGKTKQLQHLAFLLMFDEEQRKSALTLEDMQERIRRAFSGADIGLEEFEFMKMGKVPSKPEHPAYTVSVADAIWKDAVSKL